MRRGKGARSSHFMTRQQRSGGSRWGVRCSVVKEAQMADCEGEETQRGQGALGLGVHTARGRGHRGLI